MEILKKRVRIRYWYCFWVSESKAHEGHFLCRACEKKNPARNIAGWSTRAGQTQKGLCHKKGMSEQNPLPRTHYNGTQNLDPSGVDSTFPIVMSEATHLINPVNPLFNLCFPAAQARCSALIGGKFCLVPRAQRGKEVPVTSPRPRRRRAAGRHLGANLQRGARGAAVRPPSMLTFNNR